MAFGQIRNNFCESHLPHVLNSSNVFLLCLNLSEVMILDCALNILEKVNDYIS